MNKNRIELKFTELAKKKHKALISFITAGDPNLKKTEAMIQALSAGGTDIIELGVPFSDPMADGPVIQRSSERALKTGVTIKKILTVVKQVRVANQIPIILMGYYNPVLKYGLKQYFRDLKAYGVDGTILVDLPPEEAQEACEWAKKFGISIIFLLAPTSTPERIKIVKKNGSGFIYYVSLTGITGADKKKQEVSLVKHQALQMLKKQKQLPIGIGFGIKTPDQAKKISRLADGVIIGSALVSYIEKQGARLKMNNLEKWIRPFAKAVHQS